MKAFFQKYTMDSNDYDHLVVVLHWADGSHNTFFKHDKDALKRFVKTKRGVLGNKLKYKVKEYKKSQYDRLNGF